jgi:hypothetical protein
VGFLGSEAEGDGRFVCTTTTTTTTTTKVVDLASWAMLHLWLLASRTNFPILTTTDSTKVVDLASWAMLHLWAGAERTREFVAPLLHMQVPRLTRQ